MTFNGISYITTAFFAHDSYSILSPVEGVLRLGYHRNRAIEASLAQSYRRYPRLGRLRPIDQHPHQMRVEERCHPDAELHRNRQALQGYLPRPLVRLQGPSLGDLLVGTPGLLSLSTMFLKERKASFNSDMNLAWSSLEKSFLDACRNTDEIKPSGYGYGHISG